MSSNPPPPPHSSHKPGQDHPAPGKPSSPAGRAKLLKIPPIPIRRSNLGNEEEKEEEDECSESSSILLASSLGLNNIRTRSSASPLRYSSSVGAPSFLTQNAAVTINDARFRTRLNSHPQRDLGEKVHLHQSRSLRAHSQLIPVLEGHHGAFAKEMQSPRFQEILRLTSGRKKRNPDIKSFSHELNSKGVRPFPIWKHRAFGHMEEVMGAIRAKFEKLKEEVDSDLGGFAGDLVGILEKNLVCDREWRERLEDLLIVAQQCAKMSPTQFWIKCETIVQNLDDKRQELPVGILKQAHTRLLFILTRCTRLVQFQKESGIEQDHILGLHQLSDLGVYSEQILKASQENSSIQPAGHETSDKQLKMSRSKEKDKPITTQGKADQQVSVAIDNPEVGTAKSVESTPGSYRMSSWRKFPTAEKKRKDQDAADTPSKGEMDHLLINAENLDTSSCHPDHSQSSSRTRKVSWGFWGDHHTLTYGDSMICRICEVEIPIVHVEEHSRICTIADRCDLKGLTVNERLERVSETIERIMEFWTPKSTDTPGESFDLAASNVLEEFNDLSLERNNLTLRCSEDMLDSTDPDNTFLMDDLNLSPRTSCEARICVKHDHGTKVSSAGSLTPRSPLVTPRTTQVELLLSGRRTLSELESCEQISKLVEIARAVANVNNCDYSALEYMLDRLEDLKYAIQDRKVDALIVETFGRRIEKLLQEKYISLCGQIEDEKVDSSTSVADEESSVEDDAVRSLRASPINTCSKDRTSIEDFEIIKPISRGAFGRVFLTRKRATGDLFAIKVLRKADMIRKNAVQSILAERDILISVRNPFVVRFFYSFTCRENLYLVMEYLNGGDLYSMLRNLGCLDENMTRVYIAEVVLALEYLHSLNVIHRDLKPDNLLIGQDGHIKLTDFGLSKVGLINSTDDLSAPSFSAILEDDDMPKPSNSSKREERQRQSVVGTPDYLAPEILLGMGHGATADWWSVGVIMYELLVGIPPFNAEHPQQIFDNIINRDIQWPNIPDEISFEAYDLINKLLNENPVQRLGATGATEVKRHAFFKDINWDTLARQKAMFIPSAEGHDDTSYFMSRYIWNPEDEHCLGGSDFDEISGSGSSGSGSAVLDEDGDECGSLTEFGAHALVDPYSFSNFSFKNLSQLASINYDLVIRNSGESTQ
ncbi:probable serine/threonine protein kinase IRE [Vigna radiata var. radiata]|uniref:non-specific serine/threonine protein kinase n=1 Tax=Vigna radiata var. radiata TaxID=3916 RepID=A0A1S3TG24_VIGRR|nr:probable serine/threonine protein kinase IRE [Vigna radiata var. radiata]